AVFLKEHVRAYRWTAVFVGMIGVAIIVWPRLTVFTGGGGPIGDLTIGALASLTSAVFAAFATMHVRNLVKTERSSTIALYFSVSCSCLALLTIPFGWAWPTTEQAIFLVGAGIVGGIGQVMLTEAYRHAD